MIAGAVLVTLCCWEVGVQVLETWAARDQRQNYLGQGSMVWAGRPDWNSEANILTSVLLMAMASNKNN